MKKYANQNRTERSFSVDDWVYLKLQPYRQISMAGKNNQKLSPRFYGPFKIEQRMGCAAYHLRLPAGSAIHPLLHVSQLKKHFSRGNNVSPILPIASSTGQLKIYPLQILDRRSIKRDNSAISQLLIRWVNLPPEDSSWEDYDIIALHYPQFILEDKNISFMF
jgi:hypothetical protein